MDVADATLSSTGSGAITFAKTLDGAQNLTLITAGDTTFWDKVGNSIALSSLTTDATGAGAGTTYIKGGVVTTTGAQTYNDNVLLGNSAAHATVLNTTAGAVLFAGTVNNQTALIPESLTVNAGSRDVTFTGAVGSAAAPVGDLVINSTGNTTFVSTVDAASVTTDLGGQTIIQGGRVTTSADQTYNDNVLLGNSAAHATVLNTTAGEVLFAGTVNNQTALIPESLTVNAGSRDVTLTGAVGSAAAPVGDLVINSTGNTTFVSTVDAASVTTDLGGQTIIQGGRITTSADQTYNDMVKLSAHTSITGASVTFAESVLSATASARNLTVQSTNGDIVFDSVLGNLANPLGVVTVTTSSVATFNGAVMVAHLETASTGVTRFNTPSVTTTSPSSMLFANDVVVSAPVTTFATTNGGALPAGANITFKKGLVSTAPGASSVNLQAGTAGSVSLLGSVGRDSNLVESPIQDLNVSAGGGIIIGGYLKTSGAQTYLNPISLVASSTFVASALNWSSVTAIAPAVSLNILSQGSQALTQISLTGDLNVVTGAGGVSGGVSQLVGTTLTVQGATTFTADTLTGQVANLNQKGNLLAGAVSFLKANGGSWSNIDLASQSALKLGPATMTGNLVISTASVTQTGPVVVEGTTKVTALAGEISLTDPANLFKGAIDVTGAGMLKLTSSQGFKMNQVNVAGDATLIAKGNVDLGQGTYGGKLQVTSNGGDITQSGPINFKGDVDFQADTGKINLMDPRNLWYGGLLFKGSPILINHPLLLSANTNAASLNMRTEVVQSFVSKSTTLQAKTPDGDSTSTTTNTASPVKSESVIAIRVEQTAEPGKQGLVTVEVHPEVTAGTKGFSFELNQAQVPALAGAQQPAVRATQPDGRPLPSWLQFDPQAKTFSAASVPPGAFPLQVKVNVGGTDTLIMIQDAGAATR